MIPDDILQITADVQEEYERAISINSPFNSAHEAYAVLLEEVDELKAEVWKNKISRDPQAMRKEAVQVAAIALRFIHDVCDTDGVIRRA